MAGLERTDLLGCLPLPTKAAYEDAVLAVAHKTHRQSIEAMYAEYTRQGNLRRNLANFGDGMHIVGDAFTPADLRFPGGMYRPGFDALKRGMKTGALIAREVHAGIIPVSELLEGVQLPSRTSREAARMIDAYGRKGMELIGEEVFEPLVGLEDQIQDDDGKPHPYAYKIGCGLVALSAYNVHDQAVIGQLIKDSESTDIDEWNTRAEAALRTFNDPSKND